MISYQWCSELDSSDRDEVSALVAAAAEYDEDAGFSRIPPGDVTSTSRDGIRVFHLPIKARKDLSARDDAPLVIVAYLHLQVDGEGLGTVQFVVHPDYRSRGVATMLVEEIGLGTTADGGWERTVRGVTSNISTGGIYFEADVSNGVSRLAVDALLDIELTIPPGEGHFPYEGRVKSVAEVVRWEELQDVNGVGAGRWRVGVAARFREPLKLAF